MNLLGRVLALALALFPTLPAQREGQELVGTLIPALAVSASALPDTSPDAFIVEIGCLGICRVCPADATYHFNGDSCEGESTPL